MDSDSDYDFRATNLIPMIKDFADTASAIQYLDLVISVDTSVAHLAGAMGKPTWLLLPFSSDWRWGHPRSGENTKWYESMKMYRQRKPETDWIWLFQNVKDDLRQYEQKSC